jgi:hypothetical protein
MLATSIEQDIGEGNPEAVIATTLVAFALSSLLTGARAPPPSAPPWRH